MNDYLAISGSLILLLLGLPFSILIFWNNNIIINYKTSYLQAFQPIIRKIFKRGLHTFQFPNKFLRMEPLNPSELSGSTIYSFPASKDEEIIMLFESSGKRELTIASNYPYELWCDESFIGMGGNRCTEEEFYTDTWKETLNYSQITIRLHWMNYKLSNVWHRQLFKDFYFVDFQSDIEWNYYQDSSFKFGTKVSSQLPRQNTVLKSRTQEVKKELILYQPKSIRAVIKPLPVQRLDFITIAPVKIGQITLPQQLKNGSKNFAPDQANIDLVSYVLNERPMPMKCETYDLGKYIISLFFLTPVHLCFNFLYLQLLFCLFIYNPRLYCVTSI